MADKYADNSNVNRFTPQIPDNNYSGAGGEYIGWQCITSGTPGTWKGFGALEA